MELDILFFNPELEHTKVYITFAFDRLTGLLLSSAALLINC